MNIKELMDYGFTAFFGIMTIITVFRYLPKMTDAWYKLSNSIDKNTEITSRHYEHSISILEELKILKNRLDTHDKKSDDVIKHQDEIMEILEEIKLKVGVK